MLVAAAVVFIFYIQRGAHLELNGSILKVRALAADAGSSIAVVDFRFANTSNYPFVVRTVTVTMEDAQGRSFEGSPIADVDATKLFQYYPVLGQKFNETLLIRTRVLPHQFMDRMVTARFETPEHVLDGRKRIRVTVEDVDGAVSEIAEAERKK